MTTSETITLPATSSRRLEPYLFLGGRCEEAIESYVAALDARLEMRMRFSESPDPMPPGMLPPGHEHKIMHAALRVGTTVLMMSDGCGTQPAGFQGFSLAISVPTEAEVDRIVAVLSKDGDLRMPPTKTFWSPRFAMVQDRFGVCWMIQVPAMEPK